MNYIYAIRFVFKDPEWIKKILIPGVISLIPVAGIIHLLGWAYEIYQNSASHTDPILPQPFSLLYLKTGARLLLCGLIYYIPLGLIFIITQCVDWLTVKILPGILESIALKVISVFFSIFNLAYLLTFLFMIPALIYCYSERRQLRDTFDFKRIYLMLKGHPQIYLSLVFILVILLVIAASGISIIFVGIIFTLPYAFAVYCELLGQAKRELER